MKAEASPWIDSFDRLARQAGACAWGISAAHRVDDAAMADMENWVGASHNASMDYLRRHLPLKRSLEAVLPECRSIVSMAFPYFREITAPAGSPLLSRYALVPDYHTELKKRLRPLAAFIKDDFDDCRTRICVDSAPVAERYWAARCGIGTIGRNGLLYVPGYGSWVFLAEILATAQLPEKRGDTTDWRLPFCEGCGKCLDACPGNALMPGGTVDCRRCRSYLTIECRDAQLPGNVNLRGRIFGCDICQEVCPANKDVPAATSCFTTRYDLAALTVDDIAALDDKKFGQLAAASALKRISLQQLKRNAGITGSAPANPAMENENI